MIAHSWWLTNCRILTGQTRDPGSIYYIHHATFYLASLASAGHAFCFINELDVLLRNEVHERPRFT